MLQNGGRGEHCISYLSWDSCISYIHCDVRARGQGARLCTFKVLFICYRKKVILAKISINFSKSPRQGSVMQIYTYNVAERVATFQPRSEAVGAFKQSERESRPSAHLKLRFRK